MRIMIFIGCGLALLVSLSAGCDDKRGQARPVPRSVSWSAISAMDAPPAVVPRRVTPPLPRPVSARARPQPAPPTAPIDWKNRQRPQTEDPALKRQGQALFDAITRNDPERARGFFFPRKPFTPLKKAGNPDRYWQHIYQLYEKDIRRLHRKRASWSSAVFESLIPHGPPVRIRPGRVHNKIGYFRTRFARLRYRLDAKRYTIFVHTLITWQGRWYVTHLLPPPKRRRPGPRARPRP